MTQILFFMTPILWRPEALGKHLWIAEINPAHALIEIGRAPLLGTTISSTTWEVALGGTAMGLIVTFLFFARYRARVPYWL
jgi:ABC-type polysaccharide/polyol phosphate export permease